MIFLNIFVVLYGILTLIATASDFQQNGFNWLQPFYILSSLALIYSPFSPKPLLFLLIGLIGLIIIAFITGLVGDEFHWSHHIIRLIMSAGIVLLFLYFSK